MLIWYTEGVQKMNSFFDSIAWNTFMLVVLGVIAAITGEIVTFIMLGFVLISLANINRHLKEISKKMNKQR